MDVKTTICCDFVLSTGQKPHDTLKIGELFMEIEDDVSENADFRGPITLVNYTYFSPTLALVSNPCYKY
jgi:hypothetical protein